MGTKRRTHKNIRDVYEILIRKYQWEGQFGRPME
jgi:hypothetical protein